MNDKQLKQGPSVPANNDIDLDVATMVDQIWNDLQGVVSRSTIRQVLLAILPEYEQARIRTFLPILMRRKAVEMLRVELSEGTSARPSRSLGKLSPNSQAEQPFGLTTSIVLPKSS